MMRTLRRVDRRTCGSGCLPGLLQCRQPPLGDGEPSTGEEVAHAATGPLPAPAHRSSSARSRNRSVRASTS
ncbi:hypothetical protein JL475_25725 [Streptomyces sp. M2CJ-2]|uniref:hypothetical protein n=1 Tax=Streptomyces sp. M2CJ-2 TaxID=2803948 RepID=UPI00192747FF|nr:hypothetical protein [Streptomyces sp. M2CJ-2]MBL3669323.1 hypothetical protein [Streptomyces sp. M2CJ-2]